jgi:hypothetical protein
MIDYRVFEINPEGRIFSPARVIRCQDDVDAVSQAVLLVADHAVEIWAGERRIGMIPIAS